jgi:hypothetical protein
MVPRGRIELPTPAFSGPRSTGELPRHRNNQRFYGKPCIRAKRKRRGPKARVRGQKVEVRRQKPETGGKGNDARARSPGQGRKTVAHGAAVGMRNKMILSPPSGRKKHRAFHRRATAPEPYTGSLTKDRSGAGGCKTRSARFKNATLPRYPTTGLSECPVRAACCMNRTMAVLAAGGIFGE